MRKIDKTMQAVKAAAILARFCDDRDTCKGCPFLDRQTGQCIYRDGVDPNEAKKGPPQSEVDYYNRFVMPGLLCGEIVKVLDRQRFELMPAAEFCGIKLPAAHYTPDFILIHRDGTVEVVEVKSKFTRKAQRDYIYRRRLFIDKYARPGGWIFTEYIVEANHD